MKTAILGFGKEGKSLLKFLKKEQKSAYGEIWILDKDAGIRIPRGVKAHTGKNYLNPPGGGLGQFDIIFRSPGVPYLSPEIQKAEKKGVEISSATKLFFNEIEKRSKFEVRSSPIVIGVTGTKGKGTTSTLLYKILTAAGKKVFIAGNIGKPALEILSLLDKKSLVVLELSSFQLQDMEKSPRIAAILDIFPDHLDTHENLEEYYGAKANIARYQRPGDKTFFLKNSPLSRRAASMGKGKKIAVDEKNFKLFSSGDLLMKGPHNFKNAVMAATIAKSLGVPDKIIRKGAAGFKGNKHRLELVRNIRGVDFYNDSAAHNPTSAAAAIKSFPAKEIILIAGGKDRNLAFEPLGRAIKESRTKAVILFGENKNKIAAGISLKKNSGLMIKKVGNLEDAVDLAYKLAEKSATVNARPVILLSPGSASFDMFKNYEERGRKFVSLVKALKK